MESDELVGLFQCRSEDALLEADRQYRPYLMTVARNILDNEQDAEECVNDALLAAWKSIPPEAPDKIGSYLARVTRNLCLDRLRRMRATKRGGGEAALVLDELWDVASGADGPEECAEAEALRDAVRHFLDTLPKNQKLNFIRRYWYFYPAQDIASSAGISVIALKSQLARTRRAMRDYLIKEGFDI